MYMRLIGSFLGILLCLLVGACGSSQEITTNDAVSTATITANMQGAAQRVVALSPLSADIIYQLDATKLVGIPGSSVLKDNPGLKNITRVSEGRTPPNLEKIIALKPDLVIGAEGFSTEATNRLKQLNIPVFLTNVNSWNALQNTTRKLAQFINANPQPLLNRYQSFITDPNDSPTALVLVSRQPILAPNKSSWAGDLLNQFQAKNLVADLQASSNFGGYVTLSPEKILTANPDVLIFVNAEPGLLASLKAEGFWKQLQAVKNNRVYEFDYYGLVNPGSIEAIEKACTQLSQALAAVPSS